MVSSKHLPVGELCNQARLDGADALLVQAMKTGSLEAIRAYSELSWLGLRSLESCNLTAPTPEMLRASIGYVVRLMSWGEQNLSAGIVIEPSYCPGPDEDTAARLAMSLIDITRTSYAECTVLLENGSNPRFASLADIREAIELAEDPRLGVHLNLTRAFAYGYTVEDLLQISTEHVQSVQLGIPSEEMAAGCGKIELGSLEQSCWSAEEIAALIRRFDGLPMIVDSLEQRDWARLASGAWLGAAVIQQNDLAVRDR